MLKRIVLVSLLAAMPSTSFAQTYTSPGPTGVPNTGTRYLNKADRKMACTGTADRAGMRVSAANNFARQGCSALFISLCRRG